MDKSVPAGAAILLDFIRRIETGRNDASAYGVIYGHKQAKLAKPLTSMTLAEVIAAGPGWTRAYKSSAAGGYQFMNATLKDLQKELRLSGSQIFDADLQDRLGYHLLKRRGYDGFMAGALWPNDFGLNLAKEWASLPVLEATQGPHLFLQRGQSYYTGDPLNKSLVAAYEVENVLKAAKAAGNVLVLDAAPPASASVEPRAITTKVAAGGGLAAILAAIAAYFFG